VPLSGGVSAAAAQHLGEPPAVLQSTCAHLMPTDHDRVGAVARAAFVAGAAEDLLRTKTAVGPTD
jgi:hypothetical protein